ncbi:annexin A9 isoform X3 [Rhineura floridana]|uniref:annexin A9 isoform X3 n=1 Tax=Rhineura floridana TaxID=261503 RepID=UPI002AC878AF|nr:annexin A9 isoform X3 [Rhineura floridana]
MSPVSGLQKLSLADEILGHLPLVDKTAVWGTLGTIRPHLSFEVEKDVQALLKAVSGKGVAYGTIIDLLTNRSNKQRQQIAEEFLDFTKQDLLKTLEAAVSGNLEGVIVGLLRPAAQYDAHEINVALKGNRERYPGVIDYVLIRQDTKALVGTGGSDPGSLDDSEWIRILTQRSHEHLNRVFRRYHEMTGFQIEEAMAKILQGKAQEAGLTLVSVLRNTPLYFATKLYQAVKGPVASPRTLARILISRSETDLLSIRAEFRKHYGISLYSFIRAETNGNYQAALLGLCRAEDL